MQDAVDASGPGDTIRILSSTHTESSIVVDVNVTIEGLGMQTTILQGANAPGLATSRILSIAPLTTVTLRNVTLRYGAGALLNEGSLEIDSALVEKNSADVGAGIHNASGAQLVIESSELRDNVAEDRGGGIRNEGEAWLLDVSLHDNRVSRQAFFPASMDGAGISNSGTLGIDGSQIVGNVLELVGPALNSGFTAYGVGIASYGGTLTLVDTEVSQNEAVGSFDGGSGGGLYIGAPAFVSRSRIRQNVMPVGNGGGIFAVAALNVEDTEISDNFAPSGGGLDVDSTQTARIVRSAVTGNAANEGGGLRVCGSGAVRLANVTLSSNLAHSNGGGALVCPSRALELANVSVVFNEADSDDNGQGSGGGLYLETSASVALRNTLIANNTAASSVTLSAPDCRGTLTSDGYNIVGNLGRTLAGPPCEVVGSSNGLQTGIDVDLDPLASYGGPTPTHRIPADSPARNAGNPGGCLDYDGLDLDVDQRYAERRSICDVGAYERAGSPAIFFDTFESGSLYAWTTSTL